MRIVLCIIIAASFTSCISQKKCNDRYPPQIETKDSIIEKEVIVYKDTTITIPGDSVRIHDSIPCQDVVYHREVKSKSGRTSATIDINNGKIDVECKTDSLNRTIDSLANIIKTKEVHHSQVTTISVPVIKYKTPKWCWWLLVINLVYVIWRFRKPIIKTVKSAVMKYFLFAFIISMFLFSCSNKPDNEIKGTDSTHTGWYMGEKVFTKYVTISPTYGQAVHYAVKDGWILNLCIGVLLIAVIIAILILGAKNLLPGHDPARYTNYVMFVIGAAALLFIFPKPGNIWLNNSKQIEKSVYEYHMTREGSTEIIWDSLYMNNRLVGVKPPKKND